MKLPKFSAELSVYESPNQYHRTSQTTGDTIVLLGCRWYRKLACASAIAACAATGPGLVACISASAPSCLDCVLPD